MWRPKDDTRYVPFHHIHWAVFLKEFRDCRYNRWIICLCLLSISISGENYPGWMQIQDLNSDPHAYLPRHRLSSKYHILILSNHLSFWLELSNLFSSLNEKMSPVYLPWTIQPQCRRQQIALKEMLIKHRTKQTTTKTQIVTSEDGASTLFFWFLLGRILTAYDKGIIPDF